MEFSTTANSGFACGFGEAATNLHFRQNLLKLAGGRAELVRASGGLLGACCRERERDRGVSMNEMGAMDCGLRSQDTELTIFLSRSDMQEHA